MALGFNRPFFFCRNFFFLGSNKFSTIPKQCRSNSVSAMVMFHSYFYQYMYDKIVAWLFNNSNQVQVGFSDLGWTHAIALAASAPKVSAMVGTWHKFNSFFFHLIFFSSRWVYFTHISHLDCLTTDSTGIRTSLLFLFLLLLLLLLLVVVSLIENNNFEVCKIIFFCISMVCNKKFHVTTTTTLQSKWLTFNIKKRCKFGRQRWWWLQDSGVTLFSISRHTGWYVLTRRWSDVFGLSVCWFVNMIK